MRHYDATPGRNGKRGNSGDSVNSILFAVRGVFIIFKIFKKQLADSRSHNQVLHPESFRHSDSMMGKVDFSLKSPKIG
jgi:hypothetical protein